MRRPVADLPLPSDWHVLDLDPRGGPAALDRLVAGLADVHPDLAEPGMAAATRDHYAELARSQRERGVLLSAFLVGRDEAGVLAAGLEVGVVPLDAAVPPQEAAEALALVLARAVSPQRSVVRLELPAGPAVGLREVLRDPGTGGVEAGVVQVWLPLVTGSALVLTLTTPCVAELDGFTRLLATVAHGLRLAPAG